MNCACPDLCGGCPAMGIPTAIPGCVTPAVTPAWRQKSNFQLYFALYMDEILSKEITCARTAIKQTAAAPTFCAA